MYCDSKATIAISCNPVQHSRTKHIDVRHHFIKEKVKKGIVELFFVRTEYQLADLFTKSLPVERFKYLVRRLGMRGLTPAELEVLLWTHNQALMHDPLEWKLYDTCGVHHVFTKDQEIFILVEKDYPLRRGLATMMICNKSQVEQYSQMANDLILKIHNIANSLK
nr:retrovirus-related Pol polyprotein from transposon TNT 1-94 [Tanacetum cinerariifolium]